MRRSRLSLGDGSSLLIDEILSLPRDLQARLVEALDPKVRLLATTTTEPEAALRADRLRPELYFALTTLILRVRRCASVAKSCRPWRNTSSSAPISAGARSGPASRPRPSRS